MPELGVKNLFSFKRLHQSSCLCLSGFLIWWESCPEELSSLRLSWINIKSDWLRGSQYLRALLWTPKLALLPNSLLCISFHLACWFFSSILAFECRVCQSRVQSFVGFVALLLVNSSVPMFQLSRSADVADINLQPPPPFCEDQTRVSKTLSRFLPVCLHGHRGAHVLRNQTHWLPPVGLWASVFISRLRHGTWNFSYILTTNPWPTHPSFSSSILSITNMSCKSTLLHGLNRSHDSGGRRQLSLNWNNYSVWSSCHSLLRTVLYSVLQSCPCLEMH